MSTPSARLDQRLLTAGGHLSVDLLVQLWTAHTPAARPAPVRCHACGHRYSETSPLCPTAAVVRPLLRRRRFESGGNAINLLTSNQLDDLLGKRLSTSLPTEAIR